MNVIEEFEEEKRRNIERMGADSSVNNLGISFIEKTADYKYSYNFTWLGRPLIQFPQDMIAMQEIIYNLNPDLIIETGIAHGGSLIYYASILELMGNNGLVLGIDIDIREHNRKEIEEHKLFHRIKMIEGSSVDQETVMAVNSYAENKKNILLVLDSNHTHEHVLKELELYSPLVNKGSYIVVFDTDIEDMAETFFEDRPWGKGNNPKTAVWEFLKRNNRFEIDRVIENKLLITVAPDGYLKCVKD